MRKIFIASLIILSLAPEIFAMNLREKVGQLFVIRPDQIDFSLSLEEVNDTKAAGVKKLTPEMIKTLRQYPAGGFAIFGKNIESPQQLKNFVSALKKACDIFPVMAIDEEGGRIARLANHKRFSLPKFESMESIGKNGNAYDAAKTIAKYLREFGFNMNFAPVADVNTNPENIIIGNRAFGSEPELVSRMAGEYLDGLHSEKIIGSIKHFPGHGDTQKDTHSGYVAVTKTWDELLQAEIIPFRDNLDKADTVMIAHITMKNVTSDDLPATLSREIVTGKLRGELGYDGIIITDALGMGAIKDYYSSGDTAVFAIEAGCDILLMPYDYREAFEAVLKAVESGRITEERLDESVNRILRLKSEAADFKSSTIHAKSQRR